MAQETFSDRLRQAMSDRDVRQSDVIRASEMLGKKLGKSQMSQYVSGKTIPRRDVAELLARILEVDVTWLFAGDADQGETSSLRNVSKPEPLPSAQIARSATMRSFSNSTKLDNVLYDVRGPVVDEAARMEDEGERILKLNIGNPAPFGFRTPDEVVQDMRHQLPDCEGYPIRGVCSPRARRLCSTRRSKACPTSTWSIYTGNGVCELIQLWMHALLDNGDEILIPSPDYPLWTACATLAGGTPVHYICDEQAEWYPDIAGHRSKITPRPRPSSSSTPTTPRAPSTHARCCGDRRGGAQAPADDLLRRDLRPPGVRRLRACFHRPLAPDLFCITF